MIRPAPPAFLQHMVAALLSPRDQETIAGDLLEAYSDRHRSGGALPANLWYARQIASFFPRAAVAAYRKTPALVLICCFTAMCGAWLGSMDMVLHHHNLLYHESIAGFIVGQALLTMLALPLRRVRTLRFAAMLGGVAVTWLGASAWYAMIHNPHFEGYILIIAALLIVQAALTWRAMLRRAAVAAA
ncbi:MAG TPA: hypothetical protein VMD97_10045 [Candidatus Aquilonibacter sp.]|nr:hypothetical protein [Candidatus Aquilonibacter sp.]